MNPTQNNQTYYLYKYQYHFFKYHTTPKTIKKVVNTTEIPVNGQHCDSLIVDDMGDGRTAAFAASVGKSRI